MKRRLFLGIVKLLKIKITNAISITVCTCQFGWPGGCKVSYAITVFIPDHVNAEASRAFARTLA